MRRAIITLNVTSALHAGEDRHPQVILRLLAHQHQFTITEFREHYGRFPQTVDFDVDLISNELPTLPSYCSARFRR